MSAIVGLGISPKQMSRLRNGHKVRVKKGEGCNVIVNPANYNIVSRAFRKNKGAEIQLSPEEIQMNASPEQAVVDNEDLDMGLASMYGQGLFAQGGKIKPKNVFKAIVKGIDTVKKGKKTFDKAKNVYNAIQNKDVKGALSGLSDVYTSGADTYKSGMETKRIAQGGKIKFGKLLNQGIKGVKQGVEVAKQVQDIKDYWNTPSNPQTGMGLYAGRSRGGYLGLQTAGLLENTRGNEMLETLGRKGPLIKSYWDGPMDPPSRGTGVNMITGRGGLLNTSRGLPPALMEQPEGENFHMQFQLPPQYRRN